MTKPIHVFVVPRGGIKQLRGEMREYPSFAAFVEKENVNPTYAKEHKDKQPYFVGGVLKPAVRYEKNVQARTLLTLDIEARDGQLEQPPMPGSVLSKLRKLGLAGWVYTTASHTQAVPRYRVILPLSEPITENIKTVLEATTQATAKKLGLLPWCPKESWVLAQAMYIPTAEDAYSRWCDGKETTPSKIAAATPSDPKAGQPADIPEGPLDPVLLALRAAGLYLEEDAKHKGKHFFTCPFVDEHGTVNDTQTVYYEAHHDGNPRPAVKCLDTEPDTDGKPHLTYKALVQWLRSNGHLTAETVDTAAVLEDHASFHAATSITRFLGAPPVDREWAWQDFAPVGKVTVLAGPGGVAKSLLMLWLLVYGALGREFACFKPAGELRSLYVSYEDDALELHRRVHRMVESLAAEDEGLVGLLHDVNGAAARNMHIWSAEDNPLQWLLMSKPDQRSQPERTARVNWLVEHLRTYGKKVLVLDPAVYAHQLEESSPAEMALFLQTLAYIAKNAGVAVVVLHHMQKTALWATLDEINQGSLRGASSFADNARSVAVMVTLPKKDLGRYVLPVPPEEVAVLKHVKHNYSASVGTVFLHRTGGRLVHLPNVQPLTPDELAEHKDNAKEEAIAKVARKLVLWVADNPGATSNMVRAGCKLSYRPGKTALEYAEAHGYLSSSDGDNRASLWEATTEGLRWAKQCQ